MNLDRLGSKSKTSRRIAVGASVLLVVLAGVAVGHGIRSRRTASRKPAPVADHSSASGHALSKINAHAVLAALPIVFEPNQGQTAPAVQIMARGGGYSLAFDDSGATLALQSPQSSAVDLLRLKLAGARDHKAPQAMEPLPGHTNYILGNDPAKWHSNIPQFARVLYQGVYPGIDLVFYGKQGQLEYDFQVAPGADPSLALLEFSGARRLKLHHGDLTIQTAAHTLQFNAPHIYQRDGDRIRTVPGHFVLRSANRVGFAVGSYDHSRELIIDPVLSYSTYFGGSGAESSPSVAVDSGGSIYLAGSTTSTDVPVAGASGNAPFQTTLKGAQNIFILKLNPQGGTNGIEYLTYLGGSGSDSAVGIAVDSQLNAYLAGNTSSTDFPTSGTTAYQQHVESGSTGAQHVFVSVLNQFGSGPLVYSSYLSGNGNDTASGLAIDNSFNLYVTGTTTSTDAASLSVMFPASTLPEGQAYQSAPRAPNQFFVTKVATHAAGIGSIAYSTYFGGGTPSNGTAIGGGVAVDTNGNIYFTGTTNFIFTGTSPQTDFPILNAYQPCLDTPPPATVVNPPTCVASTATANDAFLAKLTLPTTSTPGGLAFSTYFGGTLDDSGNAIAIDSGAANIYITGKTISDFPVNLTIPTGLSPFQKCLNTPVNPIPPATCATGTTGTDAYVARFNNPSTANIALVYFSYFGGGGNETGLAIAVDTTSDAYITGPTNSSVTTLPGGALFPDAITLANPLFTPIQFSLNGTQNAFLARIDTTTATSSTNPGNSYVTYFGGNGIDRGTSVAIDSSLNAYFAGDTTSSTNFPLSAPLQATLKGPQDAFVAQLGLAANLAITGVPTYGTGQQNFTAGNQATFTYTITNQGPDPAIGVTATDTFDTGNNSVPLTFVSASITGGSCSAPTATAPLSCALSTIQSGATATMTVTVVPTRGGGFTGGKVLISPDTNLSDNHVTVAALATDFALSATPSSQTVNPGQTTSYSVLITPTQNYGSSITVACTLPSPLAGNTTCIPAPSSVTPGPSPTSVLLKIGTTVRPLTTNAAPLHGPIYAFWLGLPGIAFLGISMGGSKRRRRILGLLALIGITAMFALQPACSSTRSQTVTGGTPAGIYTLTITGTSGSFHQNATVALTVN